MKKHFFRALLQSLPLQKFWMTLPLSTQQRGKHQPIMPHPAHPDNFTTHPLHCPRLVLSSAQVSLVQSSSWVFAKSRRFLSANRLYFSALISMQTKNEVTKFPCSLSTKMCYHKCRKSERTRFLISNHLQPSGCANCSLATFCWRRLTSKKKHWYHFTLWGDVKGKKSAVGIFIIEDWINTRQPKENKSC